MDNVLQNLQMTQITVQKRNVQRKENNCSILNEAKIQTSLKQNRLGLM